MCVENIKFEAEWNENNIHLQSENWTFAEKVTCVALTALTLLAPILGLLTAAAYLALHTSVHKLAKAKILPSAHTVSPEEMREREKAKQTFDAFWHGTIENEAHQKVRDAFEPVYRTLVTPDGAELDAVWIRHKKATAETPTLLYCNGNFQIYQQFPFWPFHKSVETDTPCHFVLFNYRGVDRSTGAIQNASQLVLDVDTAAQWILKEIKTPPQNLHYYGLSLGGATSLEAHALAPHLLTGKHVHHNSFANSDKMIEVLFGAGFAKWLISLLFYWKGYYSNPAEAFNKLKSKILILVNPKDQVIPVQATLQTEVQHDNVVILEPNKQFEEQSEKIWGHHAAPLEWHDGVIEKVWNFLFPKEEGSPVTEAS